MFFDSITFLVFFAVAFAAFWLVFSRSKSRRNGFLLLTSYVFYGWWDWRFLSLIFISSMVDFILGKAIEKSGEPRVRKQLLLVSLLVNLGILGAFKYYNFFIDSLDVLLAYVGTSAAAAHIDVVLPVGISFYTFQTLSYTLDISRGRMKAVHDPIQFFTFVAFFPQLVAGPIERARDLLPQFGDEHPGFKVDAARSGLLLALWGMFKKVVVADRLGTVVDATFTASDELGANYAALGLLCFAGQLYLDFSSYSDIARGISRMLGYRLSENFKRPYFASSFSDFWKRWHITLSSWFRDYLYIPMGGNRGSRVRVGLNVMVVFLVSGLWHGASWSFVIWGGLNGLFLVVVDPLLVQALRGLGKFGRGVAAVVVTAFWTLSLSYFRAQTLDQAHNMLGALLFKEGRIPTELVHFPWRLTIGLVIFVLFIELIQERRAQGVELVLNSPRAVRWSVYLSLCMAIVLLGAYGVDVTDQEFIYFQF